MYLGQPYRANSWQAPSIYVGQPYRANYNYVYWQAPGIKASPTELEVDKLQVFM